MHKGVHCLVISFEVGCCLGVVHHLEEVAYHDGYLSIVEEASAFCLHRRTHNIFECFALCINGGVVGSGVVVERMGVGLQVKMAIIAALGP
eukprot:16207-Ditylum_brightwellii.AAC.1